MKHAQTAGTLSRQTRLKRVRMETFPVLSRGCAPWHLRADSTGIAKAATARITRVMMIECRTDAGTQLTWHMQSRRLAREQATKVRGEWILNRDRPIKVERCREDWQGPGARTTRTNQSRRVHQGVGRTPFRHTHGVRVERHPPDAESLRLLSSGQGRQMQARSSRSHAQEVGCRPA